MPSSARTLPDCRPLVRRQSPPSRRKTALQSATLNVDEAHAGLLIAAGALWNTLAAAATIPRTGVAFLCAEIAFMQGTIGMTDIEVRFGRDGAAQQLAASQNAAAKAEQANLIDTLRAHVR